jgi:hypothetical protein
LNAVDAQIGGQDFLFGGHSAPSLFAQPIQVILSASQGWFCDEFGKNFCGAFFERAQ